jgi:hypothetical protein
LSKLLSGVTDAFVADSFIGICFSTLKAADI